MRHIHLDPLGGIAGDMFAASLLDLFPEHREAVFGAVRMLAGVGCRLVEHRDATLAGSRFVVEAPSHDHGHHHVDWRDIRARLEGSSLPPGIREHAIGIFGALAEAEARVHGTTPDQVSFHEVGAADSIADIVAASCLIAALGETSWSVASLPLGSGRIHTAHGIMPVPAPATALLLEGLAVHDDGIEGERVTPTGAAILRYLGVRSGQRPPGTLRGSGFGFGSRRIPGISNCLRVLVFDPQAATAAHHRELAVVSFEIDDQSGEELAAGLDRLRATAGVHDVIQLAALGKKGRFAVHVQVLAQPGALDQVVAACFSETTTLGLRTQIVQGRALQRRFRQVSVEGRSVQVKLAERPDGDLTAKIEADHVSPVAGHAARTRLRRHAERLAEHEA